MDKVEQLEKLEQVLKLFHLRAITFNKTTETILSILGNTVIAALYDVFDASYENVSWDDISVVDHYIVLLATISYPLDKEIPEIIQAIGQPSMNKNASSSEKIVRIGIPITKIFDDKDELVNHIKQTTESMITPKQELVSVLPDLAEKPDTPKQPETVNVISIDDDQLEFLLMSRSLPPTKQ